MILSQFGNNAHCEGQPAQTVIEVQPRQHDNSGSDTTVCAEADVTFIHTLGGAQNVSVVGKAIMMVI